MTDDNLRQKRKTRGSNSEKRAEALNKLKTLRSGGAADTTDRYQIKLAEPIYDTVDEDEYESLVAKRKQDFGDFIVDDDGVGYADKGEEVDWTESGVVPSSEDESEGELEKKKKPKKPKSDKREIKKPSFEAAAALMGKQRISNLFTSAVFNKNKPAAVSCDSILDDVLAEITPDESAKEKRRQINKRVFPNNIITPVGVNVTSDRPESQSVNNLDKPEVIEEKEVVERFEIDNDLDVIDNKNEEVKDASEVKAESVTVKGAEVWTLNAKVKEEKDPTFSASAGLEAVVGSGLSEEVVNGLGSDGKHPFVVDSDGSLPFYMLDAYEEFYGANAGNIYLFGKVYLVKFNF